MLKFNSKMNQLGLKTRRFIVKKLVIKAAALTVDTIIEAAAAMTMKGGCTDVSKSDDLSWIVIRYDKEESKD